MKAETLNRINGLDLEALGTIVEEIKNDASKGFAKFKVTSSWKGQTKSEARVESFFINGQEVPRRFSINADEPHELLGENSAPNPQELLMAAFNACITVGYVAGASLKGIKLESLEIRTKGQLDLRGFLGLSDAVPPGYENVDYEVVIKGDGSAADFEEIHQTVMKTSPNYFNMSRPIKLNGTLSVG